MASVHSDEWDAEVVRVASSVRDAMEELRDVRAEAELATERWRAERRAARRGARGGLTQPELDEQHADLVGALVQRDEALELDREDWRAAFLAEPIDSTGTRSEPRPRTPGEVPIADVRAALERAYRLIANTSREASTMGGIIETIRVGVLDTVEQSALRRHAAEHLVHVERGLWRAFLTHRLTSEERQALSLHHRRGLGVAMVASVMRLDERVVRLRLKSAHAKVRAFIFDDGAR